MAIKNVDQAGSDGWWMQQCWIALRDQRRDLTRLENYRRGTPQVSMGSPATQSAFYRFQRQCRTNVADLVVQALIERLGVRTIRTAAGGDDDGDVQATRMWQASGMDVGQSDLNRMLATFGRACTSTSAPDIDGGWSRIVPEDPRECVVIRDAHGRTVAGFKLFHDQLSQVDYAILWRPGRKVVGTRARASRPGLIGPDLAMREPKLMFIASAFDLRPEQPSGWEPTGDPTADLLWSESYEVQDIPIVDHVAPDGVGVFERHIDLIDQINHIILQGLVISTLQAFKQRALELTEDLPKYDPETNLEIDYNDVFAADPGALWKLPIGAKIWESGAVDITGILQQAKDAIQRFAAVTRTPFSMFSSDSVNQSAAGAQLTKEGLVFKAEDYQRVETRGLIEALSIGFKFMPDSVRYVDVNGARVDRADVAGMSIEWLPAERYSLAEKAQADSQATSLPRRQRLSRIWGFTPAEVDIAMSQAAEDAMLATLAAPQAPQAPQTSPARGLTPAGG